MNWEEYFKLAGQKLYLEFCRWTLRGLAVERMEAQMDEGF